MPVASNPDSNSTVPIVDAVVIGRNEGARLVACLDSLATGFRRVIYVDSGSSDDSIKVASALGAIPIVLDPHLPFTAARARNAGAAQLVDDPPELIQFLDGDCTLDRAWLRNAVQFLADKPAIAVVCGRRRERHPNASIYNQLIDIEWDTPIGSALACGGDALTRYSALNSVGGYRDDLIAGEEPELCVRLRQAGWRIWRLDAEMTMHDADIRRLSQWARRAKRAGFAFAEGAALHGAPPERHWVGETRRALLWGAFVPIGIVFASFWSPWAMLGFLVYPLHVAKQVRSGTPAIAALFNTLAKFPEAMGIASYWIGRMTHHRAKIIEYK